MSIIIEDPQTGEEATPEEVDQGQEQESSEEIQAEPTEETEEVQPEDGLKVSFGDDEPEEDDYKEFDRGRLKELRDGFKRIKKQNQELRQQIEQTLPSAPSVPSFGPEPTFEECDYDAEEFSKKTSEWHKKKALYDHQQQIKQSEQEKEKNAAALAYRERAENYNKAKKSLRVHDYSDAESTVEDILDAQQQTVIIEAVDNPALVVYALGKNPKRAAELASIKNPVKFAYELSKLENKLKVNKRKPTTSPEKKISGTGTMSGTVDNELKVLREEAAKTGDLSKVMEHKRRLKAASR